VEIAWTIIDENAGSITPAGFLKVGEVAKNYDEAIEVQVKQGVLVRTAKASINVTPGLLEQIFVAPDPSEIGMEMTQQFVAVGADKYGNRISGLNINWSVVNGGGTIDEGGLFTAGTIPDTYKDTVTAEATQGDITRSATVDVTVELDRIAFFSDRDNEDDVFDIYIMDIEGNNQKRLTTNNANDGRFSCSPNGRRIVYSLEGDEGDMYTINDDGSWEFPLVSGRRAYEPTWSPDGAKIAFQSWENDTAEIYVMDADGGNFVQLTHNSAYDDYPTWSPDGTEIVFVSGRDGNEEIYVMSADGTNQRRLTRNSATDTWPSWSSDGKEILFQSAINYQWAIFIMDADGTDARQISPAGYSCNFPCWSPDGTQIAFHSWKDPNQAEIYLMDLDGNNLTRLTDNSADDYGPLWLPRKTGVEVAEASVIIPEVSTFGAMTAQEVTAFAEKAVVRIETDLALGSGFIIDPSGLIITNNHMVKDAKEITVYLYDGTEYSGKVKARDMIHDLALVKIEATGLYYLEMGEISGISLGEQVIVLGYPLNTEKLTVTSGLVSVVDFDSGRNIIWVQTDSAVNPGNSGGPMLDLRGRVIGMLAAKTIGIAVEGVGFAISANTINMYLPRLRVGETIKK
jgi:Tol biopolymer transport system component